MDMEMTKISGTEERSRQPSAHRNAMPWTRTNVFRYFKRKVNCLFSPTMYKLKRHYHLHLSMRDTEVRWKVDHIFRNRDYRSQQQTIQSLHGTLKRALVPMRNTMLNGPIGNNFDIRSFRGLFVKTVRMYRGLSRKQLCRLLNSHPVWFELGDKHPSYWLEFPFTPEFIERFEERAESLREPIGFGFLFAEGFPAENFAAVIADVCHAKEDFDEFKEWYRKLELSPNRKDG